jgi:DUF1009 family protein
MTLALICGSGDLPQAIAAQQDVPPLICVLEGFSPNGLNADIFFRLETLGTLLQNLQDRGVSQICLCGAIRRPSIDPRRIDALTLPLVPILQTALGQGDDGALRAVMALFQQYGFESRSAVELGPKLLPPAGVLTIAQPNIAEPDLKVAENVLEEMGLEDLGQACILQNGKVIARETDAGTDAMLQNLQISSPGGFLYKAPKPGQDLRADLPTIGPQTAERCANLGLSGIVLQADCVIVLSLKDVITKLNQAGLFLWVRES